MVAAGWRSAFAVLRRLLPAGTLSARYGLPATILSRGLLTFCFFGADAFVTLAITILRHRSRRRWPASRSPAATLAWTAGAWFQARMNARWEGRRLVRIGLVIILCGHRRAERDAGQRRCGRRRDRGVDGRGPRHGPGYAPTTLLMLAEAPPGRQGWASASLNLADVLGGALGIGIGGAAISAAVRFGWSLAAGLGAAFALTAVAGVASLAVTRRLPVGIQPAPQLKLSSQRRASGVS